MKCEKTQKQFIVVEIRSMVSLKDWLQRGTGELSVMMKMFCILIGVAVMGYTFMELYS
jgi:hypothetical protein